MCYGFGYSRLKGHEIASHSDVSDADSTVSCMSPFCDSCLPVRMHRAMICMALLQAQGVFCVEYPTRPDILLSVLVTIRGAWEAFWASISCAKMKQNEFFLGSGSLLSNAHQITFSLL